MAKKRRISVLNVQGHRDELRVGSIFKRFARFTTESLWNSLYGKMYRSLLLDSTYASECGRCALAIMSTHSDRHSAVKALRAQAIKILETEESRRLPTENSFLCGLLHQKSALTKSLCRNWPAHQFSALCRKFKLMRVKAFRKVSRYLACLVLVCLLNNFVNAF